MFYYQYIIKTFRNTIKYKYFWIKVVEMDEKYNESSVQWYIYIYIYIIYIHIYIVYNILYIIYYVYTHHLQGNSHTDQTFFT